MLNKKVISTILCLAILNQMTIKANAWTTTPNPNTGNNLPDKVYDVSAASSGGLDLNLDYSLADNKESATIDINLKQSNRYEVRYADIPTLNYTLNTSQDTAIGSANATMGSGTNFNFNGSGILSGNTNGNLNGYLGGSYSAGTTKLSSLSVTGLLQAWHYSGGYWKFTYDDYDVRSNFTLTDAQIPVYFAGSYKDLGKTLTVVQSLPTDVVNYINKYGASCVDTKAVGLSDSYVPGTLSATISGSSVIIKYEPRFQYDTNDWWSGSTVESYFRYKVNMPKVRTGYGYNALSVLGGDYSIAFTQKLMNVIYKAADGTAKFNTDGKIPVDALYDTTIMDIKDVYSESTLWGGGNMGVIFTTPIDVYFTPLVTSQGSGTLTGSASGTLTGSAVSSVVTGNINANTTQISTGYSGYISAAPSINANLNANFHNNVSVDATYVGNTDKNYTFTGWSEQEITKYMLNAVPGTTYKKPYIIPVITTITLPNGSKVNGNYADYVVNSNGTYTVSATDGKGTTVSKSITIKDIGKSKIDILQYSINKTAINGSVDNTLSTVTLEKIEKNNKIKAYKLNDTTQTREDSNYVFFLRIKDSLNSLTLSNSISGIQCDGVSSNQIVTDTLADNFYNQSQTLKERLSSGYMLSISTMPEGIYTSTKSYDGYKVVMFKVPISDIDDDNCLINLKVLSTTGSCREEALDIDIDKPTNNYVVAENNYIINDSRNSTSIYTRDKNINLRNIARVYGASKVNLISSISDDSEKTLIPTETFNINDNTEIVKKFTIDYNKVGLKSYIVNTEINDVNGTPVLGNSNYNIDLVYEPIDLMLNTDTLTVTPNGTGLNINFTPNNKSNTDMARLVTNYNLKQSNFKVAIVNYGDDRDTSALNAGDYPSDNAILAASSYKLGQTINLTTTTSNNIKLLYGIPGSFVDSVTLNQNLNITIPNILDNSPMIVDISSNKPYVVKLLIESNGYSYTLPNDFTKMKNEGKIRSLKINNRECINLTQSDIDSILSITSEGIYPFNIDVTNIYGTLRNVSKTANILDSNVVANGARLDNDSTVVITKDGLYDLKTNKFTVYTIPNVVSMDNGYSIKGIRLLNNNIMLIDTSSDNAEILDSDLNPLKTIRLGNKATDLVEYRDRIYLAEGTSGLYSISNTDTTDIIKCESTVEAPVYSLETYGSALLVGSSDDKALRTYQLSSNKLNLVDSMSSSDIYGQSGLSVSNITIKNNRLEVYPDKTNYHIIIDLP